MTELLGRVMKQTHQETVLDILQQAVEKDEWEVVMSAVAKQL